MHRGSSPPADTITLAEAQRLDGLARLSASGVRLHLAPVKLDDRWLAPNEYQTRALYDRGEVLRIAEHLARGERNQFRPAPVRRQRVEAPKPSWTAAAWTPPASDGWATTLELATILWAEGHYIEERNVRRALLGQKRSRQPGWPLFACIAKLARQYGRREVVPSRYEGGGAQREFREQEALAYLRAWIHRRRDRGRPLMLGYLRQLLPEWSDEDRLRLWHEKLRPLGRPSSEPHTAEELEPAVRVVLGLPSE